MVECKQNVMVKSNNFQEGRRLIIGCHNLLQLLLLLLTLLQLSTRSTHVYSYNAVIDPANVLHITKG